MIRVGLLLDGTKAAAWICEAIDELRQMEGVDLSLAVINGFPGHKQPSSFVYRALRNIDRKIMKSGRDPFRKKEPDLTGLKVIPVNPLQTKYSDKFPPEAVSILKDEKIDLFIRFGFRILRGDILNTSTLGILSLHHGDTKKYRGGPPAFWEVVNGSPVTKVTAQLLTEELDGGTVLEETILRTDRNSFYRNQSKLYWAGKELLIHVIHQLSNDAADYINKKRNNKSLSYSSRLYKNPGNMVSAGILASWTWRNASRKLFSLFTTNQWQIYYALSPALPVSFFRFKKLMLPPDRIWADPFVVKKEAYTIFFEEKLNGSPKAHISCITLNEKGKVTGKPEKVLEEKHHLSYPFIFSIGGVDYMVPESAEARQLDLYECTQFPVQWLKVKTLIEGVRIYDATLYQHENIWYLFCNQKNDDSLSSDAYLHIYYTKDILNGSFIPHPMNPVYRDVTVARPAGKLFIHDGKLIRPSQVSAPGYGAGIKFNEVKELSPKVFREETLETIFPEWNKFMGMHTFNHAGGLTVADVQVKRNRWF